MKEEDLYRDYEMSFFAASGCTGVSATNMTASFDSLRRSVQAHEPKGTLAQAAEKFLIKIGLSQSEIKLIRKNLLEDVA